MIKFRYAIHKETGIILTYDKWLCHLNECKCKNKEIVLDFQKHKTAIQNEENIQSISWSKFIYGVNDIFTTDDFEIIYESDFTKEELNQLIILRYEMIRPGYQELFKKVDGLFCKEWELENKYGIRE